MGSGVGYPACAGSAVTYGMVRDKVMGAGLARVLVRVRSMLPRWRQPGNRF